LSLQNVFLLDLKLEERPKREYPALENMYIFWDPFSIRIRIKTLLETMSHVIKTETEE
jgi:hypothetical protein